jgi:hypothetical protein
LAYESETTFSYFKRHCGEYYYCSEGAVLKIEDGHTYNRSQHEDYVEHVAYLEVFVLTFVWPSVSRWEHAAILLYVRCFLFFVNHVCCLWLVFVLFVFIYFKALSINWKIWSLRSMVFLRNFAEPGMSLVPFLLTANLSVIQFHFTNTLSPFTNLDYNTAGNRTNGEDHFKAKFAVNAGKRLGVGFNVDYMYGRGFYSSQSTSHFKYLMYGSYIGDRYQAHLIFSTLTQKVTENGGITNDEYIKHPESFDDNYATNEIPTVLERNWNRNNNLHVFLTHRYNLGFNRKVKMSKEEIEARKFAMASQKENQAQKDLEEARRKAKREGREFDEKKFKKQTFSGRPDNARVVNTSAPTDSTSTKAPSERIAVNGKAAADSLNALEAKAAQDTMWMKNEYVPVTSFIHTMKFDTYRRIYQAYETPKDFYADTFNPAGNYPGDSIYDKTTHYRIQNTFAISLLEGFNKWAKAGLNGESVFVK